MESRAKKSSVGEEECHLLYFKINADSSKGEKMENRKKKSFVEKEECLLLYFKIIAD